ncbi:hypothetical protein [Marinactinospora rubrisoli]|uniref:Uncharacterized protein n=1 Tax=Marinactinospora rubrisoli TaxID=2715399 RepID=A0ABW2KIE5_9ACTN
MFDTDFWRAEVPVAACNGRRKARSARRCRLGVPVGVRAPCVGVRRRRPGPAAGRRPAVRRACRSAGPTTESESEEPFVAESTELVSESTEFIAESTELVSESTELVAEPAELVSESTEFIAEPAELVPEATVPILGVGHGGRAYGESRRDEARDGDPAHDGLHTNRLLWESRPGDLPSHFHSVIRRPRAFP